MEGKTAYVVEDDMYQRQAQAEELRRAGFGVTEFVTVDDALKHMGWRKDKPTLSEKLPDVIVTDNNTHSEHNGLFLLGAAREAGVPRILVSGDIHLTPREIIAAGGREAQLFNKPCDAYDVVVAAQEMLSPQKTRIP